MSNIPKYELVTVPLRDIKIPRARFTPYDAAQKEYVDRTLAVLRHICPYAPPIVCYRKKERHVLIDGRARLKAALQNGQHEGVVLVVPYETDAHAKVHELVSVFLTANRSAAEKGQALKAVLPLLPQLYPDDEKVKELYTSTTGRVKKNKLADFLDISRPTLDSWLADPEADDDEAQPATTPAATTTESVTAEAPVTDAGGTDEDEDKSWERYKEDGIIKKLKAEKQWAIRVTRILAIAFPHDIRLVRELEAAE